MLKYVIVQHLKYAFNTKFSFLVKLALSTHCDCTFRKCSINNFAVQNICWDTGVWTRGGLCFLTFFIFYTRALNLIHILLKGSNVEENWFLIGHIVFFEVRMVINKSCLLQPFFMFFWDDLVFSPMAFMGKQIRIVPGRAKVLNHLI